MKTPVLQAFRKLPVLLLILLAGWQVLQPGPESADPLQEPLLMPARQAATSLIRNPLDLQAALALFQSRAKDPALATYLARIGPAHSPVQLALADFWLQQGDAVRTLEALNVVMVRNKETRAPLLPVLQRWAGEPPTRDRMLAFAQEAPAWWPAFFEYLCEQEPDLERVRTFYRLRLSAAQPPSAWERSRYVSRLIRERYWQEAWLVWRSGVPMAQLSRNGLLQDGGFESGSSNQGFYWHLLPTPDVDIRPDITYGMEGRRALHILFRNPDTAIAFNQVWQRLILPPDEYVLSLQYRLDEPGGGELVWRVRCMDDGRLLGAGLPLQGQSDWTSQQFSFRVPRDPACQAQLLRLEGAGGHRHERVFSGGVWLDALVLEPKLHLTTARTAGSEAGR